MNITALFVAATAGMLSSILIGRVAPRLWLATTLLGMAAVLVAAATVLLDGIGWEWHSEFLVGGEPLHVRLDGLSAFFLILLCVVGGTGAVYASEYWSDKAHPRSARSGRVWWSTMLLSLVFVLLVSNGLHFLIAWELFTLSAYFLITADRRQREVRAAGWLYLGASHAATLALFAFFITLAVRTGSWELGPMHEHTELAPLFWLALFGFGVKAGLFPLHIWLPSAHANAPSHVSAILSGVTLKMGIYGLLRFSGWLPMPAGAGWVVAVLGVASAVLGVAFALGQHDLKRLLAYHSVENIGIILIGLGFALVAMEQGNPVWGQLALAGALLHVWNHGLFKALLFFGAGSVLHTTGTREMSQLGGLWRAMPWTAGLFALGAVAISGLPPLNGFVSEWLVYLGLFDATLAHGPSSWAAIPSAILLGITGALALACFTKVCGVVFSRCSAFRGGSPSARKWSGDARRDVGVGFGVRGDWPRAGRLLAGGGAGNGGVESSLGRSGDAGCAIVTRHIPCGAGGNCAGPGRLAVAPRPAWRSHPCVNLGLRLCRADGPDAIHGRLFCGHHYRMVFMDFTPGTTAATSRKLFSVQCAPCGTHTGDGARKNCRAGSLVGHARFGDGPEPPTRASASLPAVFADRYCGIVPINPARRKAMKANILQGRPPTQDTMGCRVSTRFHLLPCI